MKTAVLKSIILAIALVIAIGSVLGFIRYVVNPPEDISARATQDDIFNPDLKNFVNKYAPDSMSLADAETSFDALVDRVNIYHNDGLVTDANVYDDAISQSAEKFAKSVISWSFSKFNQSIWNSNDHRIMLRLVAKLRKVNLANGEEKALNSSTLASLTEIETTINEYKKAWRVTNKTIFSDYQNVTNVRNEARTYATNKYLRNCTALLNALNMLGQKQERSCYNQLFYTVERLQYLYYFENRQAYERESKRIFALIKEFRESKAFGISTANHDKELAEKQDIYDKNAEEHDWPDEIKQTNNQMK